MKKEDEDAFLKSIYGVSPIKKKDFVKKELKNKNKLILKTKIEKNLKIKNQDIIKKLEKPKNYYIIEKNSINRRLKKGKVPIDKKIDFHGLSVLDAEELFSYTIINCYKNKLRCILFVTGKGVMKKDESKNKEIKLYYGKIRINFFIWIKKPELQKYILSVEQANIANGADGAFFVYLRKKS